MMQGQRVACRPAAGTGAQPARPCGPGAAAPWGRRTDWLALVLALLAAPACAQTIPSVRVLAFGEISAAGEGGPRDPSTVQGNGRVNVWEGARVVRQTSRIEARLCGRFGVAFMPEGLGVRGALDVTIQSRYPALVSPDGTSNDGVRYPWTFTAGQSGVFGFTFDHPWELVPGTWTFSVLSGGKVLAEQSFDVVVPADPGRVAEGCAAVLS